MRKDFLKYAYLRDKWKDWLNVETDVRFKHVQQHFEYLFFLNEHKTLPPIEMGLQDVLNLVAGLKSLPF